ncbi:uncharacterized protein LOC122136088 isoform X2 [Cyprinus carpio]|uniref:Uncharacterized protein LOC122136088 isoform X2 n=1 Tax=Cyprinus carpio TaxID=7962 RepID=A0A9Q9VYM7_CYPCA|nr:uncharacterized protein LOC122136088 isoform X2 [Cyprinus carpio]
MGLRSRIGWSPPRSSGCKTCFPACSGGWLYRSFLEQTENFLSQNGKVLKQEVLSAWWAVNLRGLQGRLQSEPNAEEDGQQSPRQGGMRTYPWVSAPSMCANMNGVLLLDAAWRWLDWRNHQSSLLFTGSSGAFQARSIFLASSFEGDEVCDGVGGVEAIVREVVLVFGRGQGRAHQRLAGSSGPHPRCCPSHFSPGSEGAHWELGAVGARVIRECHLGVGEVQAGDTELVKVGRVNGMKQPSDAERKNRGE